MQFVVVLQFVAGQISNDRLIEYDKLIELEEELIERLEGLAEVDGHDYGSGEMNIFILTNEPEEAFKKAKDLIGSAGMLVGLSAASRSVTEEEYRRLWPIGLSQPFQVK